jgi:hypothetical protein
VSDKTLKVTDKRMFTPDGRLRDEYVELENAPVPEALAMPSEPAAAPPAPAREVAAPAAPPTAERTTPPAADAGPPLEIPTGGPGMAQASFYDLVAVLAEPVSLYLGDLALPDGGSAENLEMARLHIDLLAVLRQRTAGNLTAQESAALDDLLYRMRLRYVQKRG